MGISADIVIHNLRVFGLTATQGKNSDEIRVSTREGSVAIRLVHADASLPDGVTSRPSRGSLTATAGQNQDWGRLKSFFMANAFAGPALIPIVTDEAGLPVWAFMPDAMGSTVLIGTDLAADLTLLRQGDPAAAANRPTEAQWGIAGERPTYLFEGQLQADKPQDRMADWWMWTLRDALIRHARAKADDILPFGAKGMVIVTGDDDQAPLEDYRAQEKLLGSLPVTYFLHPLTKHTRQTMEEHALGRSVEWEIHPDALDTPNEYDARFDEQAGWFEGLTGRKPSLVRNHGFLNDGYWGHAKAWARHGVTGSSNLPGLDCHVLNGSLLPARLALNNHLTDHWSILTAFGDGVMFALEWDADTATQAIRAAGQRVIASGVPGILVFNLHPANHERAACMHVAVQNLVENGFTAMTLGTALEWFRARDEGRKAVMNASMVAPFALPEGEAPIQCDAQIFEPRAVVAASPVNMGTRLWNNICRIIGTGARV
jgi:hypothetical protein